MLISNVNILVEQKEKESIECVKDFMYELSGIMSEMGQDIVILNETKYSMDAINNMVNFIHDLSHSEKITTGY